MNTGNDPKRLMYDGGDILSWLAILRCSGVSSSGAVLSFPSNLNGCLDVDEDALTTHLAIGACREAKNVFLIFKIKAVLLNARKRQATLGDSNYFAGWLRLAVLHRAWWCFQTAVRSLSNIVHRLCRHLMHCYISLLSIAYRFRALCVLISEILEG